MKYTVVVPVFNGEDTIGECLGSLLAQKGVAYGKDYSIIVVDDGSTDRTLAIAKGFPVEVVHLPENRGRIVARLTGAKRAATGRLLFIDSRITVPEDTIGKLDDFDAYPAVNGEVDQAETKYDSPIHTVLYLIRRRYYGKQFFPVSEDLLIDELNFRRAPKGTAFLLVDTDLFIRLTPDRTGRDVNDDTLLFHNLVFTQKIGLLRAKRLFFRYSQRTSPKQFTSWLFHRGVRFSDFYLRPGSYYFIPFLLLALFFAALAPLAFSLRGLFYLAALAFAVDVVYSIYLSENRKDLTVAFLWVPVIALIFSSGVICFWAKALRGWFSKSKPIGQ